MEPNRMATASEAHPETLDFLSRAWCNFAVQAFQPQERQRQDQAIVLRDIPPKEFIKDMTSANPEMEKGVKIEDQQRSNSTPHWHSKDFKSWIWMQQAMHPELNYDSCFQKKWFSWKIPPMKNTSIKKWMKEIKEKRKEEKRLQKAEVHAAVSIASLAAALAAVAAEGQTGHHDEPSLARNEALASAASLVAAQCAQMAELMGAKRGHLSGVIGSAVSGTTTSDILTLTAAATTSLRGAATLKARTGCINRMINGGAVASIPLPVKENNAWEFDFEKSKMVLAKGAQLSIEISDGRCFRRMVSLQLNNEAKLILKIKKHNIFNVIASKKECMVLDQHAELYKGSEGHEDDTCFQIVLTTTRGLIKLDMEDDYQCYKMWATTIHHMLMLSSSLARYKLCYFNHRI